MEENHRLLLRSAVSAHLKATSRFSLDIIRGKGKGLLILLHGAPGVGKTATAEAIAIEYGRPLFAITCGDLGTSPASIEKTLMDIFRYANLWNCILLLDEADVFVTQRERGGHNFEKNALVTVFLRVVEYYSGILFHAKQRQERHDDFQSEGQGNRENQVSHYQSFNHDLGGSSQRQVARNDDYVLNH
ncbi:hypothetical protein LQW54_010634 [Pestalotiopsis sp. IQ-011]